MSAKAQLRAAVFSAIEERKSKSSHDIEQSKLASEEAQMMAMLFRDFLSFYGLQHTLSVFEPESRIVRIFLDRAIMIVEQSARSIDRLEKNARTGTRVCESTSCHVHDVSIPFHAKESSL